MIILKLSLKNNVRRIAFANLPVYETLRSLVTSMFGLDQVDFQMQYRDDEGDLITIKTDLELKEASRLVSKDQVLRLEIQCNNLPSEVEHPSFIEPIIPPEIPNEYPQVDASATQDYVLITRVQKQIETEFTKIMSTLSKFVNDMELKKNFNHIMAVCDQTISQASTQCKEKFVAVKETIQAQASNISFEQQMNNLKAEIRRLLVQMQSQLLLPPIPQHAVQKPVIEKPVEYEEKVELKEPLYPVIEEIVPKSVENSLLDGFEVVQSLRVLPQSVSEADVNQLESMGFIDIQKNVLLLQKHKGDISAVIDELLN